MSTPEPAPVPADQADGIKCPDCSIRLLVTTTRNAAPGLRVRYLQCARCGLSGRTEERLTRVFRPNGDSPA